VRSISHSKGAGAIVSIQFKPSRSGRPRGGLWWRQAAVNSFRGTGTEERPLASLQRRLSWRHCSWIQEEVGTNSMWTNQIQCSGAIQCQERCRCANWVAERYANAIVFLSSAAAGHVTGQVLPVSGGSADRLRSVVNFAKTKWSSIKSEKEIMYDVKDYVATITINRPKTSTPLPAITSRDGAAVLRQPRKKVASSSHRLRRARVLRRRRRQLGEGRRRQSRLGLKFNFNRHIVECDR
jgi:hypothetical protein